MKFTATVTPATGSTATPTGTVTFYNGCTSIGTGTVACRRGHADDDSADDGGDGHNFRDLWRGYEFQRESVGGGELDGESAALSTVPNVVGLDASGGDDRDYARGGVDGSGTVTTASSATVAAGASIS